MERTYTLKGLDCPNCAAKIEREISTLEGVTDAAVNLMQQTLTVRADGIADAALTAQIETVVHTHEPDVAVIAQTAAKQQPKEKEPSERGMYIRLAAGAMIYVGGLVLSAAAHIAALPVLITAYLILGWDVVWQALRNICKGRIFDELFLMSISTIGAFCIGEYPEAVAVMLFYQIGELFQRLAVQRSRGSISALLDIRPDTANLMRGGEIVTVASADVRIGDIMVVKAGERIPLDGIITEGSSMLDTSALTGESVPRSVKKGDAALSGCINQSGALTVEVTKTFGESTASKIIDMVENAAARKAPTERFITTFARYYTPVVVIAAALLALIPPLVFHGTWADWLQRAFVFLIVSCPCALVISVPLTFFGGIGAASKRGVLIKGSNYLEALNRVKTVVFDKTGTLTQGVFHVTELHPQNGFTESQLLEYAAQCEHLSNHPIAKSILEAYGQQPDTAAVSDVTEISGYGIRAVIGGKPVYAGSAKLMEQNGIAYAPCDAVGTKVYLAVDGTYAGCIVIADELKPDSKRAITALRQAGITNTVMLTGDDEAIGKAVSAELGLDTYHAQLLPEQKVEHVEQLEAALRKDERLAFVGDGINDAPVLARADVGIAMGALGSDAAIEAADVVLMTDEPSKLAEALTVAQETRKIVVQNIVLALGIKLVFLLLGALGLAGMWMAVFGDVGVTVIAVLNAMRILKK